MLVFHLPFTLISSKASESKHTNYSYFTYTSIFPVVYLSRTSTRDAMDGLANAQFGL
jgi:hypothetical protein